MQRLHLLLVNRVIKNNIKQLRETKGITQEDLANSLAVSRQTVIAMEKGNYEPSLGLALKVARFFGMSVEKIFKL